MLAGVGVVKRIPDKKRGCPAPVASRCAPVGPPNCRGNLTFPEQRELPL
jgi:hypothetical protein